MEMSKVDIKIPCDIIGRNAHRLVYKLQEFKSSVYFMTESRRINAKSLLGLLSANIKAGDIVQVICYNDNYHIAIDDLDDIITIVTRLAVMDDED